MVSGASPDDRAANSLENVTKTIGNLLDGYDIRLRPNFGGKPFIFFSVSNIIAAAFCTMYQIQQEKS